MDMQNAVIPTVPYIDLAPCDCPVHPQVSYNGGSIVNPSGPLTSLVSMGLRESRKDIGGHVLDILLLI